MTLLKSCSQWNKDTKMKANHNEHGTNQYDNDAVPNGTKILKWKQITTIWAMVFGFLSCSQWNKDTKMKANHNSVCEITYFFIAVPNGTKILKWKQITTFNAACHASPRCSQWNKDTKMKANHNYFSLFTKQLCAVPNGTKILKWKQITTLDQLFEVAFSLFPMEQRY